MSHHLNQTLENKLSFIFQAKQKAFYLLSHYKLCNLNQEVSYFFENDLENLLT